MSEADVEFLFEERSPNGNVWALLENRPDALHFYLHGGDDTQFGMRAVWVRNLQPAPADFSASPGGEPPMMPASACAHPQGAPRPDAARLRVVWFEEGDGAALFEGDQMLAAIPPWSGMNGFHGYARDCTAETPIAWPLKEATAIVSRIQRAEAFWRSWEGANAHWPQVQDAFMRAYESVLGKHVRYWGIDGGKWPPKAIALFETDAASVLLTLGVSIRPMPKVEMSFEDPSLHRRMELGIAIERQSATPQIIDACARYISAQTSLPWTYYTWLGDRHTVQCDPSPVGGDIAAMLLLKDPAGAPPIQMPAYRGDPVNLLWMTPITAPEWQSAQSQGSDELMKRLTTKGPIWPHRPRAAAV